MANEITVKIPDIGGATDVDVIEILVKPGEDVHVDTPLIVLESEKASMEIPSPAAGKISTIAVKTGDMVSEGDVVLTLLTDTSSPDLAATEKPQEKPIEASQSEPSTVALESSAKRKQTTVSIPDIGGATDVDVIEVMVQPGDSVEKDQPLITLEGDKATMDIPSPFAGVIERILLKTGDKVSQGSPILMMMAEEAEQNQPPKESPEKPAPVSSQPRKAVNDGQAAKRAEPVAAENSSFAVFAGPGVRRLARELGVNLADVKGQGRKSRVTKEDVQSFVKSRLAEKPSAQSGFSLPPSPSIDFTKFGAIDIRPLNKIKRLTGVNVHRSWITIPHVTQFDEADITDLEAFRKSETELTGQAGYKLTILGFVVKAVANALSVFPQFNASLDADGENLIYKQYFNVGIAVETPAGLVVPVIKQVNQRSVIDVAKEMARLSKMAREKTITPADMSGGCFTISSLGGIGGTAFTPIVNSPEVAILGLSRSVIKPVYINHEFKPRLMLPLSLSYDHRVIDGAEAARFTRYIANLLEDLRRMVL